MSVGIDSGDWRALVRSKVDRAQVTVRNLASTSDRTKWNFIEDVLREYVEAAETAMGSVKARGGYPNVKFHGIGGAEDWKPLSIYTVAAKNGYSYEDVVGNQDILKAVYDMYVDSTYIWEDTGGAKGALDIDMSSGTAGIFGSAAGYASVVEEGGEGEFGTIPARPLFHFLNEAFLIYVRANISNKSSTFYKKIRKELKQKGKWE